jgi:NAD(P)-dependent dehydrogenase (short-subunit alcohol dehydrogenase family)
MTSPVLAGGDACILLTGASSGIGRSIAIALSANNRLILNGRDASRLEETRLACVEPSRHLAWPHDLAAVTTLERSLQDFLALHEVRVAAFVHCAAALCVLPLRSTPLEKTTELMNVNFLSAMEITRVLVRKNVNQRQLRSIVFISSIASQFGAKGFSAYGASKAALDALMKSLAVELAPEIRANSVLPGNVRTPMTESMFEDPETAARLVRDYPLGIGLPADISNAVEFLISDKARWITGQQLVVDGGRTTTISA